MVRVDERVGEALLTTPVLASLAEVYPDAELHLVTHPRMIRVFEGDPRLAGLHPLDPKARTRFGAIMALRALGADVVINAGNWEAPSVTHALVARLVGPRAAVLGPDLKEVAPLFTHPVPRRTDTSSELLQRLHLITPLVPEPPNERMYARVGEVGEATRALLDELGKTPFAVVNPGGRLDWRRVPDSVFVAAAEALVAAGITPVVTWGPGEEGLARTVADGCEGARVAPPTTLDELGALMQAARLVVCNNTGPMHLAVALDAPTLAFFLKMDVARWGHHHPPHRMVDLTPVAGDYRAMKTRAEAAVAEMAAGSA